MLEVYLLFPRFRVKIQTGDKHEPKKYENIQKNPTVTSRR